MIEKHKNLIIYSFDCLTKYRLRTIVILITVLFATTMISAVLFTKDGLVREASYSVKVAPDLTVQYQKTGRLVPIPVNIASTLSQIDGVERVSARTWGYIGVGSNTFTCVGLNTSDLDYTMTMIKDVESGRFLSPWDNGSEYVVIGKLVQNALKVDVGDNIFMLCEGLNPCKFTVVGIFSASSSIYTADMILMSIADANTLFLMPPGYATDLLVYVEEGVNPKQVATNFSSIPSLRVLDKDILERGYQVAYESRSGIFVTIWTVILTAVTLIAFSQAIIIGNQSKFETGLLKTFGFSTLDIIEVRLMESFLLTVLASSLGMLTGFIYAAFLNAPGLSNILLGWAFIPQGFSLPLYLSFETIFSIYAIMVIPIVIATVVPAWLNAITDPEIAMRKAAV